MVKKDGRREAFERQKALAGLRRACDKRAVPLARIEQIVDAIERELIDSGDKEIPSEKVGERVMKHLREVDPVAYVRFASVYRQFEDIDELRSEIEQLSRALGRAPRASSHERRRERSRSALAGASTSSVPHRAHAEDERWMDLALRPREEWPPSPNPHVGAVLVKNGELVATGHHERAGGRARRGGRAVRAAGRTRPQARRST